jgi:diguanylate cyclase (GGDEF)-like protein
MRRSFRTQVLLVFLGVIVLGQGLTTAAVLNATYRNAVRDSRTELAVAGRVFDKYLSERAARLSESVRILAADFAFKEAVASGDAPTVDSALANHGARVQADMVMLLSLRGEIVASTHALTSADDAPTLPLAVLLRDAGRRSSVTSAFLVDHDAYQVVIVPVLAPQQIGWLTMGFRLDKAVADEFKSLTGVDSTIVTQQGGRYHISATTLPTASDQAIERFAAAARPADDTAFAQIGDAAYLSRTEYLDQRNGAAAFVVLHKSAEAALAPYKSLRLQLFGLSGLVLALCAAFAVALANGVTRPINQLAVAARRIEGGVYSELVDLPREDEIGALARTLNSMQKGIADREAQIVYQAHHDALTGLPNRGVVPERLVRALQRANGAGGALALLLIDLNRFKEINDSLGHATGDAVLKQVAQRLSAVARDVDLVARLGGDEFLFEVDGGDERAALEAAERLVAALQEPIELADMHLNLEVSIGIVLYPQHGSTPEELLRRADIAMYTAKAAHARHAIYRPGQDEDHLRKLALINDLRQAIEQDDLFVLYQPQVNVGTGVVAEVEALVRWRHRSLGLMSPAEFVPLAEQSGHIRLLTHWVLRAVVLQLRAWQQEGLRLRVSINLSPLDLLDATLPDVVMQLLTEHSVAPACISLEITESAVMTDAPYALAVLERLKECGVGLSIDDFGTGYSSLAQLKRLPVNELKIDKSFVMSVTENEDDEVIVRSTIDLAHNMGLKVTAEGVETPACWSLLKRLGCDSAQGFLFSRPLEPQALSRWLRDSDWTDDTADRKIVG